MRTWNLHPNDPTCLNIAADGRLNQSNYANDHIWQINLSNGKPAAFAIETTYGLRAHSMRIFPRFIFKGMDLITPNKYHREPVLETFFPNYLAFSASPFKELKMTAEYWIPQSEALAGRFSFQNQTGQNLEFHFELISILNPMQNGESMNCTPRGVINILEGKTSYLSPVCILKGGAQSGKGPYAGLSLDINLPPGEEQKVIWAMATYEDAQDSLEQAQRIINKKWDAELARLEMLNRQQTIEISTGNPDWDACFSLTQKTAYGLIFPNKDFLPFPSFVLSRQPDQGYSPRGDGTDYSYLWNGQTALDAYYLSSLILPGGHDLIKGFLDNFFSTRAEDGTIDGKPGLAGQRFHQIAQPILATLALQLYEFSPEPEWLAQIYPALLDFIKNWFSEEHDRDQDGFPEWGSVLQSGLTLSPLYDTWNTGSDGVNISTLESPSLAAFLYRECKSLMKIAHLLNKENDAAWLEQQAQHIAEELGKSWNSRLKLYRYRDYKSHSTTKGILLRSIKGKGKISFKRNFKKPQRLVFHFSFEDLTTRPIAISIYEKEGQENASEQISVNQITWGDGTARCTSHLLYETLNKIELQGLNKNDKCRINTVNFAQEDISLMLPLWAGIPDEHTAKNMIEKNVLGRYFKKHGIPICPEKTSNIKNMENINMLWNHFLGEGMLNYGYQKEAAKLVTRLMSTMINVLKKENAFYGSYNAYSGVPSGERNTLTGLAPLGLFLRTLGIKILTPERVVLSGNNPYPWPVTVKYRGMSITFHKKDHVITFPTGQTITTKGAGPHHVSLS